MKTLLACVLATSLTLGLSPDVNAQEAYPNKIIRLVVPYSAGGTGDQIGRLVGDKLGELLGQGESEAGGGAGDEHAGARGQVRHVQILAVSETDRDVLRSIPGC